MKKQKKSHLVLAIVIFLIILFILIIGMEIIKRKEEKTKTFANNKNFSTSNTVATVSDAITEKSSSNSVATNTNAYEKPFPRKYDISMNHLYQLPELPSGCEAVSLTMLLNYYGYSITKTELVDKYLVYSYDYVTGFCGDPYSSYVGGGCFAPGMVSTANAYLSDVNSTKVAKDITGTDFSELIKYVSEDTPVLVWTTIGLSPSEKSYEATEYNGNTYYWDYMEHCVVLAGYDLDNKTVTVYDPIDGIVTRDYDTFEEIYNQMYKMAIILEDAN